MRVVAAVIFNKAGQILLAQRPPHKHLAGLWEFPGGKVESSESEEQALGRELQEELELSVKIQKRLGEFSHQYPDGLVTLIAYQVFALSEPRATQDVHCYQWLNPEQISLELLVPADVPILDQVKKILRTSTSV